MSSVSQFSKKVRSNFKVRPMLPFGAPFEIGTIGVVDDDHFSPRGTVASVLGAKVGQISTAREPTNWQLTSGSDVKLNFLAGGTASTLFPAAPKAKAKIEVSFSKEESFLVTVNSLKISRLKDPAILIQGMLAAHERGTWRKEYVLVYETITPAQTLVLLSKSAGTKLLLAAGATVTAQGLADIAGKFSLTYQDQDVVKFDSGGLPLFYNAFRVKKGFWTGRVAVKPFAAGDLTAGVFELV